MNENVALARTNSLSALRNDHRLASRDANVMDIREFVAKLSSSDSLNRLGAMGDGARRSVRRERLSPNDIYVRNWRLSKP
jgi:hypothetical protein